MISSRDWRRLDFERLMMAAACYGVISQEPSPGAREAILRAAANRSRHLRPPDRRGDSDPWRARDGVRISIESYRMTLWMAV